MNNTQWIDCLEKYFILSGLDYKDIYWIIRHSIIEEKTTFLDFIDEASNGFGFAVHEELSYALDQDWDFPDKFDRVYFHFGEMEECDENSISIDEFILLIRVAVHVYARNFPKDKKKIFYLFNKLKKRYLGEKVLSYK